MVRRLPAKQLEVGSIPTGVSLPLLHANHETGGQTHSVDHRTAAATGGASSRISANRQQKPNVASQNAFLEQVESVATLDVTNGEGWISRPLVTGNAAVYRDIRR